jgi:hypothetical protein
MTVFFWISFSFLHINRFLVVFGTFYPSILMISSVKFILTEKSVIYRFDLSDKKTEKIHKTHRIHKKADFNDF